jgi:hypothetical protein
MTNAPNHWAKTQLRDWTLQRVYQLHMFLLQWIGTKLDGFDDHHSSALDDSLPHQDDSLPHQDDSLLH